MSARGRKPVRWDLIESGSKSWIDPESGRRVLAIDEMGAEWSEDRRLLARAEHAFRTREWFIRLQSDPLKYPRLPAAYRDDESMLWEYASLWSIEDMKRGRRVGANYYRAWKKARGPKTSVTDEQLIERYRKLTPRAQRSLSLAAMRLSRDLPLSAGTIRNRLAKLLARDVARNK